MATYCKVRLYETVGGRYIDLSDQIQGPTLKAVENYGVTGTINVINELDSSSQNLLSASCNRWSSGTGAMRTGMFLYIYKGSISSSSQLGIFIITDLSVSDDVISLTFGDAIQILRATGADYYRNHYSEAQQHNDENAIGGWDYAAEKLYVVKPSGVTLNAANGDIKWAVNKQIDTNPQENVGSGMRYKAGVGTATFTFSLDQDWLFSFTIYRLGALSCRVRVLVNGIEVGNRTFSESSYISSDQERTISLFNPTYVRNRTITVIFDNISSTYDAYVKLTSFNGSTWTSYQRFISGNDYEDAVDNDVIFVSKLVGAYYEYANNGEVDQGDDTKYYITGIDNVSSIDSSLGSPSFSGRCKITYLVTAGGMPMSTVFSRICSSAGFNSSVISSARKVGIFRCGGDYFHNYLLALADMNEPSGSYSGRQHGIAASETSWGSISLGYRYKASDSAVATLYYGGDSSPGSGAIVMMKFSPSLTMKYRPYMAVTKGAKDDGTPIVIAVRDPMVSIGSSISLVDGSITTVEDAALSSYAEIITNRSKDWEGTVELSGIYTQFMVAGTFVGGVPVRIYDSRYGMSGYAAKVKEVMLDFTNQTTKLYLNNYSEMYANSVIDSSKMAYSAGNLAVEASSSDLFTRQYVSVVTGASLGTSTNHTIEVYNSQIGYVSAVADLLKIPDLGICVLSAYFKKGVASIVQQYGITAIRVDHTTVINIDPYHRPDKYSNQSLIVNVQMSL